jgi:DNA-binding SARP family transcriptional activator
MQVRVRVLGAFEVEGIEPRRLGSKKARTLLTRLALARGQPVSADALIECLWPDALPAAPEDQLSVLVSRLRAVLGAARLPRRGAGYALLADWLDLDALAEMVAEAGRRLDAGSVALARAAAEAALQVARGPLLADEPVASWAAAERASAERLVAAARHVAARAALAGGDHAAAADLAAAGLDADAYDEVALRLLMRAEAASGRPAAALAAYARLRERLDEDLGAEPAPETDALHLAILRGELAPETLAGPHRGTRGAGDGLGARAGPPRGRLAGRLGSHAAALPVATAGAAVASRWEPQAAGAPQPLPGRVGELAALDAALERSAGGAAGLVLVEGEAGIGKSRLLRAWRSRAAAVAEVLEAQGDELEQGLPLQPIANAVDAFLHTLPTVDAVLAALGPEHAILAPLLPAAPPAPPAAADPIGGQSVLFAALLAVISRLAARRPVVLLFDDLHLADRASVEWLHFVARRGADLRLLVVGAVRPEEAVRLPEAERIVLQPLDRAAAALVVGPERVDALYERSGGHPLFLVELAAAGEAAGGAGPAEAEGAATLPASLREAVAARCDRAGPAAASLRTAALLGPALDLDLLAAVLKLPPLEVLGHLEEGVRRRLLVEEGGRFTFRHELVRDALASAAGAARRALVHREAGRTLAARSDAEPLAVAHHARLGGDLSLAAGAYAEAAARAASRYDHAASERLLTRAVELADSAPYRLKRSRARVLCGDYDGAEADALAALEAGAGAEALEAAGWAAYYRRDFAAARRYADDGARLATGEARACCLALAGRTRHATGDLTGAAQCLEEAARLATDPLRRQAMAAWLGQVRWHQGQGLVALDLAGPAARALHVPELQPADIAAKLTVAAALGTLGRVAEALAALDDFEAEIEHQGASRYRGRAANYRAWLLRSLGELAAAEESNRRALEEARRAGNAEPEVHALLDLADARLLAGDPDGAAAYLAAAAPLQAANHAYRWRHVWRDRMLRGRLALLLGRPDETKTLAAALRTEAAAAGVRRYADHATLLGARAAAALGEPLALEEIGTVLQALPQHSGPEAWRLAAEAAAATGCAAFWDLAAAHAARLAAAAGDRAAGFRRFAGARLEKM